MKPIIMSTEDVRGILDGCKTMVRIPVKNQDGIHPRWNNIGWLGWEDGHGYKLRQPYQPGDVLWVRETWAKNTDYANHALYIPHGFIHKATGEYHMGIKWRSPVTMPREAARLFLRVTDVRVERVQDISEKDAKREGVCGLCYDAETGEEKYDMTFFKVIWDARNAKRGYGWDSNPWTWVIEFKRIEKGVES